MIIIQAFWKVQNSSNYFTFALLQEKKNNSQEILSLKILKILKKNDSKEPAFLPSTTVPVANGTRPWKKRKTW